MELDSRNCPYHSWCIYLAIYEGVILCSEFIWVI